MRQPRRGLLHHRTRGRGGRGAVLAGGWGAELTAEAAFGIFGSSRGRCSAKRRAADPGSASKLKMIALRSAGAVRPALLRPCRRFGTARSIVAIKIGPRRLKDSRGGGWRPGAGLSGYGLVA